jgi:hypothetical protein
VGVTWTAAKADCTRGSWSEHGLLGRVRRDAVEASRDVRA